MVSETTDTIAAIATPGERGGIGIVRISGPGARDIGQKLTRRTPRARTADYCAFLNAGGKVIDRGIMLYFSQPASYTGEDVLELHGHGGRVVMKMLLAEVLALGARQARPGEFTERAFLNGKLDLLQAEAVADLIDSASETAARSAMRSLEGVFSDQVHRLQAGLVDARVQVEAGLDFPDEDVAAGNGSRIRGRLDEWIGAADSLLAKAQNGRVLREGRRVVIAGRPNVGKSSLMNRLAQTDRAIVDASPGTTRDTIEEDILVGGVRLNVVDTAGIRDSVDGIEAEGVRRSIRALRNADIVLQVTEPGEPEEDELLNTMAPRGSRRIVVCNKIDLSGDAPAIEQRQSVTVVRVSARTGAGLDLLSETLLAHADLAGTGEDAVLARTRHIDALCGSKRAVERARSLIAAGDPAELAAEELRQAQLLLGRITGEFSSDELLSEIFSRFCIGK